MNYLILLLWFTILPGLQSETSTTEEIQKELGRLKGDEAEDASRQLEGMGEPILPEIKDFLKNADEATRKKVETIIETIIETIERTRDEVNNLIPQLGASEFKDREAASTRLAEIGPPALSRLKEASGHADPNIRMRAASLTAIIAQSLVPRRLVRRIHQRWFAGDLNDLDENDVKSIVQEAVPHNQVQRVYYARTCEISDHLETDDNEEFKSFKALGRLGGKKHCLTKNVVETVEKNNGYVFLDRDGDADNMTAKPSQCLIVSLPEARNKPSFKSYLIMILSKALTEPTERDK